MAMTDAQYAAAAKQAFGDLGNQIVILMTAVGMAESQSSGGDTAQSPGFQRGGEGAAGAFQIQNNHTESSLGIPGFWSNSLWRNPATNAKAARKIYDGQGIKAWSAYTNGAYSKYLARAQAAVSGMGSGSGSTANQAGAVAWFSTIVPPGGKVPAEWNKVGNFGGAEALHIVKSNDGLYMFTGHTNKDGSGYGNISWNEGVKSQMMYIRWGTDGISAGGGDSKGPTPVDPGEVTPVQPFGDLSNLFGDIGPALWIGGGSLLVLLGLMLLAKDVTPIGKVANIAGKVLK